MNKSFKGRLKENLNKKEISLILFEAGFYLYDTSDFIQTEKMIGQILELETNDHGKFAVVYDKTYWKEQDRRFSCSQYNEFKSCSYPFIIKGRPNWNRVLNEIIKLDNLSLMCDLIEKKGIKQYNKLLRNTFNIIESKTGVHIKECENNIDLLNFLETSSDAEKLLEQSWLEALYAKK